MFCVYEVMKCGSSHKIHSILNWNTYIQLLCCYFICKRSFSFSFTWTNWLLHCQILHLTMEQGCLWADIAALDVDRLPGLTWRVSLSCEVALVVVVWLSGIWGGVVQGRCLAVVVPCVMGGRYAVGIAWWVSWFPGFQCGCRSVQSQFSRLVFCIF